MSALYFIAYVFEGRQAEAVDALRRKLAEATGTGAALKLPPHITLFRPFAAEHTEALSSVLRERVAGHAAFDLRIERYGAFEQRVWYLKPEESEHLRALHEDIVTVVRATMGIKEDRPADWKQFHATLAYKDVTPDAHKKMWMVLEQELMPVSKVRIDSVCLLKKEGDAPWAVVDQFPLQ